MTSTDGSVLDAPPPELRFKRHVRPIRAVRELWRAREIVVALAERDLRARYKQTFLGVAWALVTPLTLMVVFTLFFNRAADIDTEGAPYALFSYLGLLPWTFFSSAVSTGGIGLVSNMALLNKVYCPREVFPVAYTVEAGVDCLMATVALVLLFPITGYVPRGTAVWVPVLLPALVAFTMATALLVSALTVYLRDLRQALPIVLQFGLFATPVAYGIEVVPQHLRLLYAALNPLAPVIDGLRRTVLYGQPPHWGLLAVGTASSAVMLAAGFLVFKRLETGMADVA